MVINQAPSRANRASIPLPNEGFFVRRPRPAVLTGLPPAVREAAAALPAAVGSSDGRPWRFVMIEAAEGGGGRSVDVY